MDYQLVPVLVGSAIFALLAACVVVVVKMVHRVYLRFQGIRTARYMASVGHMVNRRMLPPNMPSDWAHDSLFHEALAEYHLSGSDAEVAFIDGIVDQLGIRKVLRKRMRNRFSISRRLRAASAYIDLATKDQILELRSLLTDRSHHVAIHAAKALSRMDEIASVPAILRRASRASEWHAARFADALIGFGPEAGVPIRAWIRRSIDTKKPPVRMVALTIQVLGHIGDPHAEKLLLELLESDESEWRVKAATALGPLGSPSSVAGLIAATDDEYWPVRAKAATSLGRIGEPAAAESLRTLLNDRMWWVRQNAAEAIGLLPGGGPMLVEVLSGDDPFAADAAIYRLNMRGEVADGLVHTVNGSDGNVDAQLVVHVDWMPADDDGQNPDVGLVAG